MADSADGSNPLVGTWKLVSFGFALDATNERGNVYDEHPAGCLTFAPNGRMTAILTAGDRAAAAADAAALFGDMMAYSGHYRLPAAGTFVVTVDVAWHPSWLNTEQTRFYEIEGDTLSITSPPLPHPRFPGGLVRGIVTCQRE
jgi:Lipocalin-like domain